MGVTERHGEAESYKAQEAIVEGLGVIRGTAAFTCKQATNAGDPILGVADHDGAENDMINVVISGLVKAVSGAAILLGAKVTTDTNGKFVTATTGDTPCGWAETATGGADEEFSMRLIANAANDL